jgi:hypothetical protein
MRARPLVPLNRQILDEASAWFVDFRVGDVDAPARERFDQWLRASPEHIRAYMEIAKTYVELPQLKSDNRIDIDALIRSTHADTNVVPHDFGMPRSKGEDLGFEGLAYGRSSSEIVKRRFWLGPRAVAGGVLVAALASTVVALLALHRYPAYLTGVGENRSIKLVDGSTRRPDRGAGALFCREGSDAPLRREKRRSDGSRARHAVRCEQKSERHYRDGRGGTSCSVARAVTASGLCTFTSDPGCCNALDHLRVRRRAGDGNTAGHHEARARRRGGGDGVDPASPDL